ncbi:MAG: flagellar hook-basal body complex protein FliE [Rhodospirillales bacterium]
MPNPVNSFATAAAAYHRALAGAEAMEPRDRPDDASFAGLVKTALEGAIAVGKTGETQSVRAVAGTTDLNQVITAVAEAEVVLNTVVAVRDKVIEAYREIIRMPM